MKTWQGIAKADQFHSFLPSSMSLFEFCNLSKILLSVTKDCYSLYHVHCTLYIMYIVQTYYKNCSSKPSSIHRLSGFIFAFRRRTSRRGDISSPLPLSFPPVSPASPPSPQLPKSTQWPSYWAVLDSEKDMLDAISVLSQNLRNNWPNWNYLRPVIIRPGLIKPVHALRAGQTKCKQRERNFFHSHLKQKPVVWWSLLLSCPRLMKIITKEMYFSTLAHLSSIRLISFF